MILTVQKYIIFLDISKAFDKVPHDLFLHKLKTFGFNIRFFKLVYRLPVRNKLKCYCIGKQSENLSVTYGVPQCSILEPFLFILYVYDICRSLLEYCTPLWSPYQVNEIMRIERVHRHVTKFVLNEYSSDVSYINRRITLGTAPLCYRRFSIYASYYTW